MLVAFVFGLGGCSDVVPSSGPRAPTTAEQVKVYQKAPRKYEKLGEVTLLVTSTKQWEKDADATPGFEKLRAEAASRGANGLLLVEDGEKASAEAGVRFQGTYYFVPIRQNPPTVVTQAIYVLKE
jgi:hypothetical protein